MKGGLVIRVKESLPQLLSSLGISSHSFQFLFISLHFIRLIQLCNLLEVLELSRLIDSWVHVDLLNNGPLVLDSEFVVLKVFVSAVEPGDKSADVIDLGFFAIGGVQDDMVLKHDDSAGIGLIRLLEGLDEGFKEFRENIVVLEDFGDESDKEVAEEEDESNDDSALFERERVAGEVGVFVGGDMTVSGHFVDGSPDKDSGHFAGKLDDILLEEGEGGGVNGDLNEAFILVVEQDGLGLLAAIIFNDGFSRVFGDDILAFSDIGILVEEGDLELVVSAGRIFGKDS